MTSYDIIYKKFESKIEDLDLAKMTDEDQLEMKLEWLNSALGIMMLEDVVLKSDLTQKNDELGIFTDDLALGEIEVIALYMVVAWYEPKVNSLEHTSMFVGGKEEKWTSQKDHTESISSIQEKYRKLARTYIKKYGYKTYSY